MNPDINAIAEGRLKLLRADDDAVDHPAHYNAGGIEAIDVIEAFGLGFSLGNVVKYIARAGKKDAATTLQDLRKAQWYLSREIGRLRERG